MAERLRFSRNFVELRNGLLSDVSTHGISYMGEQISE